MQKAFNFKLLVPPRAHVNQVSALKPNETGVNEENCVFSQPVQVGKLLTYVIMQNCTKMLSYTHT